MRDRLSRRADPLVRQSQNKLAFDRRAQRLKHQAHSRKMESLKYQYKINERDLGSLNVSGLPRAFQEKYTPPPTVVQRLRPSPSALLLTALKMKKAEKSA